MASDHAAPPDRRDRRAGGGGKSTAARLLAARLGYALLDTGAIYRSMALRARERGVAWDDGPGVAALADGIDISFRLDGTVNQRDR